MRLCKAEEKSWRLDCSMAGYFLSEGKQLLKNGVRVTFLVTNQRALYLPIGHAEGVKKDITE